jgi:hypothetical protein
LLLRVAGKHPAAAAECFGIDRVVVEPAPLAAIDEREIAHRAIEWLLAYPASVFDGGYTALAHEIFVLEEYAADPRWPEVHHRCRAAAAARWRSLSRAAPLYLNAMQLSALLAAGSRAGDAVATRRQELEAVLPSDHVDGLLAAAAQSARVELLETWNRWNVDLPRHYDRTRTLLYRELQTRELVNALAGAVAIERAPAVMEGFMAVSAEALALCDWGREQWPAGVAAENHVRLLAAHALTWADAIHSRAIALRAILLAQCAGPIEANAARYSEWLLHFLQLQAADGSFEPSAWSQRIDARRELVLEALRILIRRGGSGTRRGG